MKQIYQFPRSLRLSDRLDLLVLYTRTAMADQAQSQ